MSDIIKDGGPAFPEIINIEHNPVKDLDRGGRLVNLVAIRGGIPPNRNLFVRQETILKMSDPIQLPFSQLLRQWRKQFKLSQVSACKFLRVPYRTYQDWENEQRNPKQLTREAVEERMKKYVPTPE